MDIAKIDIDIAKIALFGCLQVNKCNMASSGRLMGCALLYGVFVRLYSVRLNKCAVFRLVILCYAYTP